jgi:hypothetical protein
MAGLPPMMPLLLRRLLAGARRRVRVYCARMLLAAIAALVAAMGFAMLAGSAFLSLADSMSAQAAAAVTGGGLVAAAALLAVIAPRLGRERSRLRPAAENTRDGRSEAAGLALTALLAGCAFGASPDLRRVIADLLIPPVARERD